MPLPQLRELRCGLDPCLLCVGQDNVQARRAASARRETVDGIHAATGLVQAQGGGGVRRPDPLEARMPALNSLNWDRSTIVRELPRLGHGVGSCVRRPDPLEALMPAANHPNFARRHTGDMVRQRRRLCPGGRSHTGTCGGEMAGQRCPEGFGDDWGKGSGDEFLRGELGEIAAVFEERGEGRGRCGCSTIFRYASEVVPVKKSKEDGQDVGWDLGCEVGRNVGRTWSSW